MRYDLYTSEDRAREARAYYRQNQRAMFAMWNWLGAVALSMGVYGVCNWYNPIKSDEWFYVTVVCLILFVIIGRFSIRLIAVYQGVVIGTIAGFAITFLSALLFVKERVFDFDRSAGNSIALGIGLIVGVILFVMGVLGAFLPDIKGSKY